MHALVTDQGGKSGWCIIRPPLRAGEPFARGAVLAYGRALGALGRGAVMAKALELAGGPKALLAVYEDHSKMKLTRGTKHDKQREDADGNTTQRTMKSILGQGANLGRWLEHYDLARVPATNQRGLDPYTWRRALFGKKGPSMSRPRAKQEALLWAEALLGSPISSDDVAEAIAMSAYVFREWLTPQGGQRGQ